MTYSSGSFTGEEYTDTVTLGPLTVTNQGIAIANSTTGFPGGVDGILGYVLSPITGQMRYPCLPCSSCVRFGPSGLSRGTVSNTEFVENLFENAYEQGQMTADVIAISFAPASQVSTPNGLITFGGTDASQFTGPVQFA